MVATTGFGYTPQIEWFWLPIARVKYFPELVIPPAVLENTLRVQKAYIAKTRCDTVAYRSSLLVTKFISSRESRFRIFKYTRPEFIQAQVSVCPNSYKPALGTSFVSRSILADCEHIQLLTSSRCRKKG